MNYEKKLLLAIDKNSGIITSEYCTNNNIPTIYLSRLMKKGIIKRVARGIYTTIDSFYDELYFFQYRFSKTIYSYETALYLLGQTDKIIQRYDITVPQGYHIDKNAYNINVHYIKNDFFNIGVENVSTMFGNKVRAYSYERVICDFILHSNSMDKEVYIKTLKNYQNYEKNDITKLYSMAKIFNIDNRLKQIMEIAYE